MAVHTYLFKKKYSKQSAYACHPNKSLCKFCYERFTSHNMPTAIVKQRPKRINRTEWMYISYPAAMTHHGNSCPEATVKSEYKKTLNPVMTELPPPLLYPHKTDFNSWKTVWRIWKFINRKLMTKSLIQRK